MPEWSPAFPDDLDYIEKSPFRGGQSLLRPGRPAGGHPSDYRILLKVPTRERVEVDRCAGTTAGFDVLNRLPRSSTTARGVPTRAASASIPTADLDEIRALASIMTWKTAVVDIAVRWSQGRDPGRSKGMSQGELREDPPLHLASRTSWVSRTFPRRT